MKGYDLAPRCQVTPIHSGSPLLISSILNCKSGPTAPVNLPKNSRIACRIETSICFIQLHEFSKMKNEMLSNLLKLAAF
jgi:hypothetical protein